MEYYKKPESGTVFAYETEHDRNEWGASDLVEMTQSEIDEHLNQVMPTFTTDQVSRAQGKAALIRSGLWQGVLDYVASIEDATEKALAQVALNDTVTWQRTSPFLNTAATALGLTQTQLDDLFVAASEIEL